MVESFFYFRVKELYIYGFLNIVELGGWEDGQMLALEFRYDTDQLVAHRLGTKEVVGSNPGKG